MAEAQAEQHPAQALRSFQRRVQALAQERGCVDEELLGLLFSVEQATQQAVGQAEGPGVGGGALLSHTATQEAALVGEAAERNARGQRLFTCQRWREALSCFADAAELDVREPAHAANMAAAALKLREFPAALQAARRALQLDPQCTRARVREAKALEGLGSWAAARCAWQALAADHPDDKSFERGLRRCHSAVQRAAQAECDGRVDARPALPQHPVPLDVAAAQLQAAHAAMSRDPMSQVARAAWVECLVLCSRWAEAQAAAAGMAAGAHRQYLMAECALRGGEVDTALRIILDTGLPPSKAAAGGGANKLGSLCGTCHKLQRLLCETSTGKDSSSSSSSDPSSLQHARLCACEALLTTVQQLAPWPGMLALAYCRQAEAWLDGPEGGAGRALEALSCAPQDAPSVLWLTARAQQAAGEHEAAFCTLRRLLATAPAWPVLHQALCAAATAASATGSSSRAGERAGPVGNKEAEGRALLGLPAAGPVSKAAVGRAYRRQATLRHPDSRSARGTGASSAGFVELQEAYELLLGMALE